ncbi:uncharacterized protein Gasu_27410 [Galdieria sulphuraria]|uniref:Uncharacterized protein n=1 Tax=Galdieria sulphuraria TaxID=130081 RepID=M2XIP0_GALSU|nr:uncharacterized protein Gasu_27410 [Galdieria sulphuraria]EME29957.1 hypothetical protein Gasu_27410 [Galdieria sulphuraria]|eukprot:XP_005706477.1 hypothetical protein Gasu_27410 [Galdieria sulphuraria]
MDHLFSKSFNVQTLRRLRGIRSYCQVKETSDEEPSVLKLALEESDFQTFFQVARKAENHGIGERFYLDRWRRKGDFDSYWTITRIQRDHDGNPSKVFGYYHYKGLDLKGEREVEFANCRGWKCERLEKERIKKQGRNKTIP